MWCAVCDKGWAGGGGAVRISGWARTWARLGGWLGLASRLAAVWGKIQRFNRSDPAMTASHSAGRV